MATKKDLSLKMPDFRVEKSTAEPKLYLNGVLLRNVVRYSLAYTGARTTKRCELTLTLRIRYPFGFDPETMEPDHSRYDLRIEQDEKGSYLLYLDQLCLQRGVLDFQVKAREGTAGSIVIIHMLVSETLPV